MIVLILVLVWVAALLPIAVRKRSEWELTTSIAQFRQRRRALAPVTAVDLASQSPDGGPFGKERRARLEKAMKARLRLRRERRRRTLTVLSASLGGSLVLGAIPGLGALWDLSLVAACCTVGYVALLVYFRRIEELSAERERKVVELAHRTRRGAIVPMRPRPSFVIVEATS